jgi:hypothetical protein
VNACGSSAGWPGTSSEVTVWPSRAVTPVCRDSDSECNTVVVRVGRDVLRVSDNVPANAESTAAVGVAYRRAAQALAAKILARMS